MTPPTRIRVVNDAPVASTGDFVLYFMCAARRARWNFALERAVTWANELDRPLLVLEALRCGHAWASDRFHAFVMQGMRDNATAFAKVGVAYHPYVEPVPGEGRGLLEALSARACVVVTDDAPMFFLPRMIDAFAAKARVRVEAVDGNGLMPLSATRGQVFSFAHQMRRFVQKNVRPHLGAMPAEAPLDALGARPMAAIPRDVLTRWPRVPDATLAQPASLLASLPIDHTVAVVEDEGGAAFATARLDRFVRRGLSQYGEGRNHPDEGHTSKLSFHLHFGHVSVHEIFAALAAHHDWSIEKLGAKAHGKREGFWNVSEAADAYLDELVTWRELGLARAARRPDPIVYEDLPAFARATLDKHAADPRKYVYDRAAFEEARTHDPVWNATMRQLREEGRIHGYLRMLWGKKILEWTPSPREALETMIALNDRWSVDGRDPASYTNIGWVLGLYDRPWAPERPVFGVVRFMSSDASMKKLRMREWLARWSGGAEDRGQTRLVLD
jgi:deoxyribodipyrimidine photo-lyase